MSTTEGVITMDGMREVTSHYLQTWIEGISQLDPHLLQEAVQKGGLPVGEETGPGLHGAPEQRVAGGSVMPTGPVSRPQAAPIGSYSIIEPWVTGSPALLYGPGAIAEEPAAAIPPEALPLAEAAMKVLRSKSLAYMHPDVCFHSDGVLHHKDLVGVNSYVSSMAAAARTYQLVELRPLVVPAVDLGRRVAFVLSSFKLKHRATSSVSHGIQVDAVRFDEGCKITDVWVRRQLTVEEREIMLKGGPASHPGAVFDETAIEAPGAEEVGDRTPEAMAQAAAAAGDEGGAAGMSTEEALHKKMEHSLKTWQEMWEKAHSTAAALTCGGTEAQHPELDQILEPNFNVADALGIHARGNRAYQHIHGIQGARDAINEMVAHNEMHEWIYAYAISPKSNVGFALWKAAMRPRSRQGAGIPRSAGPLVGATTRESTSGTTFQGGPGEVKHEEQESYTVEGLDVVLFNPQDGKMQCIYQMRSPTHKEDRKVLEPSKVEAAY